jgi:rSAM/selenodomain-associated transferase 1
LDKSALIIFVRNPVLGQVKTRIAKDLGNETTLKIYEKLLAHTHSITCDIDVDVFVFYADYINNADLWSEGSYKKRLQAGNDLGERMKDAFIEVSSEGYENICIIGSDCFELTTSILSDAFASLNNNDFVIGPSEDGGYYLLGMSKPIYEVFEKKAWSSDKVYPDTINDIKRKQLSLHVLPTLSDVDTFEDCKKYEPLLSLTY